jgi:hypothetical protein
VKEDLSDSELREKLAAWQVEAQLPRDFQQPSAAISIGLRQYLTGHFRSYDRSVK